MSFLVGWRVGRSLRAVRWGAWLLACVLAAVVVAVAAIPSLIQWGLRRGLEQATGMRASALEVHFNLGSGQARIGALRLVHPRSGRPVGGWSGVTGRIRYAPLFRGTVRFRDVTFDHPFLAIARRDDRPEADAIPLSALTAPRARSRLVPTVDLGRLEIAYGAVTWFDAVGEGRTIRVEDVMLRASDIAFGRAGPGGRTTVSVSARWEGGRFEASGWVRPFARPLDGDLALRVANLNLSLLDALLSAAREPALGRGRVTSGPGLLTLPLSVRDGRADASAHLTRGPNGETVLTGTVDVRQAAVSLTADRGRISARWLHLMVGRFDVERRILQDSRMEGQDVASDLAGNLGVMARAASVKAEVGELNARAGGARAVMLEFAGLTGRRGADGAALEGRSVRASAEALDLVARSGRAVRVQAEGLVGRGIGPQALGLTVRAVRAAADEVGPGARVLRGPSFALEGAAATGTARPLGTALAVRAAARALDMASLSGADIRVEADQVAVAEFGPEAVSATVQTVRATLAGADLRARTVRGVSADVAWLAAARAGDAEPFGVFRQVHAEISRAGLAPLALEVVRLEMDAPAVRARRDASGIDLARLARRSEGAGGTARPAAGGGGGALSPSALAVAFAQVRGGTLQFSDVTVSPPALLDLRDITANLANARPGSATLATLVASARTGTAGNIQVSAQFTPGTFRNATGSARLQDIDVDPARPYLGLPPPLAAITGRMTVDAEARPTQPMEVATPGALAWKIVAQAQGRDLAARDAAGKVLAELPALGLRDVEVTLPGFVVTVGEVALDGITVPVERDAAGTVHIAGLPLPALTSRGQDAGPSGPAAAVARAAERGPVRSLRVRHVRVRGTVPLVDRARPYPLHTAITDLALDLQDVGTGRDDTMGLQVSGRLEDLTFAAAGTTRFDPLHGDAFLDLKSLDLVRWADYLPDAIRGRLADLRGDAHLEVTFGPHLADLVVGGRVEAAPLQLADPETGDGILGAERATLGIGRLTLAPLSLHLQSVVLEQPWAAIERRPNGRVNILALVPPRAPAADAAPRGAPSWRSMTVVIDRLAVNRGLFDVADRKMNPPFVERLRGVTVEAENLSTEGTTTAHFKLSGRFSDNSNLSIEGVGVPRMDHPIVEFSGRLQGFNLVGLSPYVRVLTSHGVQRGKIDIDAHYRLEAWALEGENRFRIDQLGVGEPEEWPDRFTEMVGVSLPTVVSLLQDSDGVIELDVPVRGDLSHPQFDFGDVMRTAIANAVVATVTAPLRLIGRIFAGDGRIEEVQIEPILFESGSARLAPAGQQAVQRLVAFLNEAPRARVQLVGYAEPEQDGRGLQAAAAIQTASTGVVGRLARRLGFGTKPPSEPDLQRLARRRAVAVQEEVRRTGVDPGRVFLAEATVEAAKKSQERGKPPQGRVEVRLMP